MDSNVSRSHSRRKKPDPHLIQLGSRIRTGRKVRKLAQVVLARKVGLDRAELSRTERGLRDIKTLQTRLIERALGLPAGALLADADPFSDAA